MAEMESQGQTKKKGGGSKKIIVATVGVVAVAAVIGGVYLFTHKPVEEEKPLKETITAENVEERVTEIFEQEASNAPAYYTATQNSRWVFTSGSEPSNLVYVENSKANSTPVYFDLIVDETGETVYSSPVLTVGASINFIKLDTELEKGEYPCTMVYHLVDEKQNTLTTVSVGVTVVVEN